MLHFQDRRLLCSYPSWGDLRQYCRSPVLRGGDKPRSYGFRARNEETIMRMSVLCIILVVCVLPLWAGEVYNLKVVTDANPDYHDMKSLVHSATSRWDTNKDK